MDMFAKLLQLSNKSIHERVLYGQEVVEQFLPFFEGMAKAVPEFSHVLEDNYKSGIAGVLFANALERVASKLRRDPEQLRKVLNEGRSPLQEAISTSDAGAWDAMYLGISAFIFPALLSANVVSVQPLTAPTGVIFYKTYMTDRDFKGVSAGTRLSKDLMASGYASDSASQQIGTGNGTATSFSGTLNLIPVVPRSVVVSAGSAVLTDDGNGNLTGDGTGTINYTSGAIAITFNTAPASNTPVVVSYRYVQEGNVSARIKLRLEKDTITVQERKLGFEWTAEAAQDLMAYHGIAIEDEIADTLVREVASEIDARIINDIRLMAIRDGVVSATWSKTPPPNTAYVDHKTTLLSLIKQIYAKIIGAIGNVPAGASPLILCGMEAFGIIQDMPNFTREPSKFVGEGLTGMLDNMTVYATPFLPDNEIIVRLYSPDVMFTDYIFAPYRVEVSPPVNKVIKYGDTVETDMFSYVKGILSRDGFKQIRQGFNARIVITP